MVSAELAYRGNGDGGAAGRGLHGVEGTVAVVVADEPAVMATLRFELSGRSSSAQQIAGCACFKSPSGERPLRLTTPWSCQGVSCVYLDCGLTCQGTLG